MAIKFSDIDIAALKVSKMRGAPSKRFGQVTVGDTKEKVRFQIPGSKICFDMNEYGNLTLSINHDDFVVFVEELQQRILNELTDAPSIDMGLKIHPEGRFDPTFRIKVTKETGYYHTDGTRADESILQRGNEVHVEVQLHCTYKIDDRWGVSWKAVQIRKGREPELEDKDEPEESEELEFLD